MNPFILLHGAFGVWDETILLVLVGGFLLSLVWSIYLLLMLALTLLAGFALASGWLIPSPVAGHANQARSEPAPNSALAEVPQRVVIWFTEPLEPSFSEIQVLNSQAQRVDHQDSKVDDNDPTVMSVSLQPLRQGTYTVAWRNLSQ